MNIRFLTLAGVMEIHRQQIELFGGSHGIRDQGLLESAVAAPLATFGGEFLHGDIAGMAAALAFGLIANHPFVDGNKRVGAQAGMVFLELNGAGQRVHFADAYEGLVLQVASGTAGKEELEAFFREVYHLPPA